MIVKNEVDGSLLKVVDILHNTVLGSSRRINSFLEYGALLYVSTDFGIVQFNLSTLKLGDSYLIGDLGSELKVRQSAIFDGYLYAATSSGIRRGLLSNPNLIDYHQWELSAADNWSGITAFGAGLYAVNGLGELQQFEASSNSFRAIGSLGAASLDMRSGLDYLVITTASRVYVYNKQLVLQRQINSDQIADVHSGFSVASILGEAIYIGTQADGLRVGSLFSSTDFENISPAGPLRNNVFGLTASASQLWLVYGDYDVFYNPYPLDQYGLSRYAGSSWEYIPYEKLFGAKSMSHIAINPANENEVYASSYFSGLLKLQNQQPKLLYNQTNSSLESLSLIPPDPNYIDIRINGVAFDANGNLWISNSRISNGLQMLSVGGQWKSYGMGHILTEVATNDFSKMLVDKNNTKWMGSSKNGVLAYNESSNIFKKISFGEQGNLPVADVRAIALDHNKQLWIGTSKGLRVLYNVNDFLAQGSLRAESIIIEEDGLAQELLYEQFITDIEVDGANNKWIATAEAGLFMVSENGQEIKYHFTAENSPLPSNSINDVVINPQSGEVFIASTKGLLSFKGIATEAAANLNNVYVYPNPVRPDYIGTVKISGLVDKANVKISDVAGNLVYEARVEGGTLEWDTTAFGKYKVASGVYMIFVSAADGGETKVKKVMIIR